MHSAGRRRIHVMADTASIGAPSACAALRLMDPFSHPAVTDAFEVSLGPQLPASPVDALVFQRFSGPMGADADAEAMVRALAASGVKLIFDIDDNLLDAHPDPVLEKIIEGRRRSMRLFLQLADRVTVSTKLLRDRFERLNPNITVLPNALDERRLGVPLPKAGGGRLRIGYFGTFTHARDLMSVTGPLRAALSRLEGKATLVLCGISTDTRMPELFDDVAQVEILPVTSDYPSFMRMMFEKADWDIGLAPLAQGRFERAKSDIKFLEYAAFGIPGLYSAHPAYEMVEHGVSGMIAEPEAWTEGLLALAHDADLRARIVNEARDYLFAKRTLAASGEGWRIVVQQLLDP